jgi:predicted NBD/HSP70 family sugar kinase
MFVSMMYCTTYGRDLKDHLDRKVVPVVLTTRLDPADLHMLRKDLPPCECRKDDRQRLASRTFLVLNDVQTACIAEMALALVRQGNRRLYVIRFRGLERRSSLLFGKAVLPSASLP